MKSAKVQRSMTGRLLKPLTVGTCAAFLAGGQLYYTSPVVAVESADKHRICFETQDSRYSLSLRPFPPAAFRLSPAMLAA